MKLHAIVVLWLGVQAPTEEVHVVLEVPPEVDEGMCSYFYALSPDHLCVLHRDHIVQ